MPKTHKVGDSDRLQNAGVALLDQDFPSLKALLLSSRGVVQQEQVLHPDAAVNFLRPACAVKTATKRKTHPLQAVFSGNRHALVDGFPGLLGPVLITHDFGREPDFAVALVRHGFGEFLDRGADFLLIVVCGVSQSQLVVQGPSPRPLKMTNSSAPSRYACRASV